MKKILIGLSALLVLFFVGCGGGGGSSPDTTDTPKTIAIDKIKLYADDNNTQSPPTVEDYADAGVIGVTSDNIDDINSLVATLTASDVDTTEEIQQVAHDAGILLLPTANAGPDKSVEVDQVVTITGSGTDIDGMIVSYEWKKGNSVLADSVSFDYTPDTVGTDTLTFTVMDDDGGTASDEMNVTVTAVPPNILPTADAGPDKSVEVDQAVTITGSGTDSDGTIVSYEWKIGNSVLADSVSFDYTPDTVGTDTLTFTVMDDDGETASDEMNVTVTAVAPNILPVADAGADQTVVEGETVTLDGSASTDSDGTITDYEWKEGNTILSTNVSFDKSNFSIGVHTLTLSVTDDDNDTAFDEMNVTVTEVPPNILPLADAGADQTVVEGETVTLDGSGSTDSDGTITAYEWKEGNTILSTAVSFEKSNFSVGIHTLTLTVTDNDNDTASDEMNVTVTAVPPVSFASDVMPIFVVNCQGCHSTSSSKTFKVGDAAYTYNNIITNSLIDTVSPDSSDILLKGNAVISHNGGDQLSDDNSNIVRDWIVEGGLNN